MSDPKVRLTKEDRFITSLQTMKWKALEFVIQIDKEIDYYERHKKVRRRKC
jgi:hypothetical protein